MRILILFLLLAGCANAFESDEAAQARMEQVQIDKMWKYAYEHREFDRKDIPIYYVFFDDVDWECRMLGTKVSYKMAGCTVMGIGEPCTVLLSHSPTKLTVEHEKAHCRYGNWHVLYTQM